MCVGTLTRVVRRRGAVGLFPVVKMSVGRRCFHLRRSRLADSRLGRGVVDAPVHSQGVRDTQEKEQEGPHEGQRRMAEVMNTH